MEINNMNYQKIYNKLMEKRKNNRLSKKECYWEYEKKNAGN